VVVANVVITGGTRGIGLGLARGFLAYGHRVVVCGRNEASVERATRDLEAAAPGRALAVACDVSDEAQVRELWHAAAERFGRVDFWVNNAGVGQPRQHFLTLPRERADEVVITNLLGLMNGCRVALEGMVSQGGGRIYNMEGLGSNGMVLPGLGVYGASKVAVTYFTRALVKETRGGPVRVGYLSPGMVTTDLLSGGQGSRSWVVRALADRVEDVAPFLVEGMLSDAAHGGRIAWLTRGKVLRRFLRAPLDRRRDPFAPVVR
jgi:NAD(P)-dependent dehydrogenase (short-subunit alcohol dehydrogenase family)